MDVVSLLESRNRCLRRLLERGAEFLAQAEMGDLSLLDSFMSERDATIRAFELYDRKLTELIAEIPTHEARQRIAASAVPALTEREELLRSLVRMDERIFGLIEAEKGRLATELGNSRKAQSNIKKFRSEWIPESGEGLDKTL